MTRVNLVSLKPMCHHYTELCHCNDLPITHIPPICTMCISKFEWPPLVARSLPKTPDCNHSASWYLVGWPLACLGGATWCQLKAAHFSAVFYGLAGATAQQPTLGWRRWPPDSPKWWPWPRVRVAAPLQWQNSFWYAHETVWKFWLWKTLTFPWICSCHSRNKVTDSNLIWECKSTLL